jgi:hypothetical protein
MFKDVGVIDNDDNLFSMAYFDSDNNCQRASDTLFEVIEYVYIDNDFKTDLSGFIIDLIDIYKEVGFNLGCLFIEIYFTKEFKLNLCVNNKLEMKKIFNLNGYIENVFYRMWDIKIRPVLDDLFSDMQNIILFLKREFIVEAGVPEEAINFVLKSAELRKLSYFLIKTYFKCGFFWRLAFNTLHMQLSEENI